MVGTKWIYLSELKKIVLHLNSVKYVIIILEKKVREKNLVTTFWSFM